jgi:hypothetical protein
MAKKAKATYPSPGAKQRSNWGDTRSTGANGGGGLAKLRTTFWDGVGWFNNGDFTSNLAAYALDTSVKMKRLDDSGYHEGIAAVKEYFLHNGNEEKAFFMPDSPPDFQLVNQHGFVSGTAKFIDKTTPPATATRRIAYSMTYKSANNRKWKAIHLWGKYIDEN